MVRKVNRTALALACGLALAGQAHAQGTFRNLDFESANVPGLPPGQGGFVSLTDGMPGWNSLTVGPGGSIGHNTVSIGGAALAIEGPQYDPNFILFGQYTAYLVGDSTGPNSGSIWQTGLIPATARSLFFLASPTIPSLGPSFQVTIGNVNIPVTETTSNAKYSIWVGDISQFAGQTEQLMFTALPGQGGYLDQITFSPNTVPEPTTGALFGIGVLLSVCRMLRVKR
jgi:hypothetical protein